ncbi:MAG TPA: SPOR domain-containing protein, partial [Coxiellaceae bacterium]|nr:SPOR domain-containing protein [Coxiellaceae bacterium]
ASTPPPFVHHAKKHAVTATGKHTWAVQVGVFSEHANAHRLLAQLRKAHFNAYAHTIIRNGRSFMAVFVGPQTSLAKAENTKKQLARTIRVNGEIKHYRA